MTQRTQHEVAIAGQKDLYERAYKLEGIQAQRLYPNEEFLRFMGRHYFPLTSAERGRISVLEVGSGTGSNLWMVAKEGFEAYGVDFAPEAVALSKRSMAKWSVEFRCCVGDMTDLAFADCGFDVVADVFSATHIPYQLHQQFYKEAYRVTKSGGRFFSYHPSDRSDCFVRGTGRLYDEYTLNDIVDEQSPYQGNGLMCFLPMDICREQLSQAGFVDINIERIGRTYGNGKEYFEFLSIDAGKGDD